MHFFGISSNFDILLDQYQSNNYGTTKISRALSTDSEKYSVTEQLIADMYQSIIERVARYILS